MNFSLTDQMVNACEIEKLIITAGAWVWGIARQLILRDAKSNRCLSSIRAMTSLLDIFCDIISGPQTENPG